jgi:hypothetical protein
MSNEEVTPAVLAEGESVIPAEEAEANVQELIDSGDLKISKPKEVPQTTSDNVIASPGTERKGGTKSGSAKTIENGIVGSKVADNDKKLAENKKANAKPKKDDKIAIHSTRNVNWPGVGKVTKGYNIVSPEVAEQWLTRSHIREATPEEVLKEYGI